MSRHDYGFVFVCQGGSMEPQAALLAASLRRHVHADALLVAAVPDYPEVPAPTPAALEFMGRLGVEVRPVSNPVCPSYPIANKLGCFLLDLPVEKLAFLDTDMLCLRDFHGDDALAASRVAARLTDFADLTPEEWGPLRAAAGLGPVRLDHRAIVSGEPIPLCFNAGAIFADTDLGLGATWVDLARRLNDPARFPRTRPFLDQSTLPMALEVLGGEPLVLDETYNCSSPIRMLDVRDLPTIVHYYESCHFLGDELLARRGARLVADFPGLASLLEPDPYLRELARGSR